MVGGIARFCCLYAYFLYEFKNFSYEIKEQVSIPIKDNRTTCGSKFGTSFYRICKYPCVHLLVLLITFSSCNCSTCRLRSITDIRNSTRISSYGPLPCLFSNGNTDKTFRYKSTRNAWIVHFSKATFLTKSATYVRRYVTNS